MGGRVVFVRRLRNSIRAEWFSATGRRRVGNGDRLLRFVRPSEDDTRPAFRRAL